LAHALGLESTRTMPPSGPPTPRLLGDKNPFCFRLPLLRPEPWLGGLTTWLGFLFSRWATGIVLAAAFFATVCILGRWDEFIASFGEFSDPLRQTILLATWLLLKVFHEGGHAIVCKRYGGYVREAGVVFFLFAPVAYVDVTSSWRFSRWQRIHTALAGIYVELLVASVAALIWCTTDEPLTKRLAADVVILSSCTTILFNANPLMRFDGYYVLSDLLGLPNLYQQGQRLLKDSAKRWLLGVAVAAQGPAVRWPTFVGVYGALACVWRAVMLGALIIAAAMLFHGAGIVLAIAGILTWWVLPLVRMVGRLARRYRAGELRLVRPVAVASLVALLGWGVFAITPIPLVARAPAIVEFSPPVVLRAPCAAFVAEVYVKDGDRVTAGERLIQLRNEAIEIELARLTTAAARAEQEIIGHLRRGQTTEVALVRSELEAFQKQLAELRQQVQQLEVRAPAAGNCVSRRLASLAGSYVQAGEQLLEIGSDDAKRLRVSLSQSDVQGWDNLQQKLVRARAEGGESLTCRFNRMAPRASDELPYESLSAHCGGPLTTMRDDQGKWKLVEPRFDAVIELDARQSRSLYCGQHVYVFLGPGNHSLGGFLAKLARDLRDYSLSSRK